NAHDFSPALEIPKLAALSLQRTTGYSSELPLLHAPGVQNRMTPSPLLPQLSRQTTANEVLTKYDLSRDVAGVAIAKVEIDAWVEFAAHLAFVGRHDRRAGSFGGNAGAFGDDVVIGKKLE